MNERRSRSAGCGRWRGTSERPRPPTPEREGSVCRRRRSSTKNRSSLGRPPWAITHGECQSSRVSHERTGTTRSPPPNTRTATFQWPCEFNFVLALSDRPLTLRDLGH